MPASFGTSGLRGLVTELGPDVVHEAVRAFLSACPHGGTVLVGRDLRDSSPEISRAAIRAVANAGIEAVDCGELPTPALALAAFGKRCAAIMVTGSHVPADRNGLKFYASHGEIGKADEARISALLIGRGREPREREIERSGEDSEKAKDSVADRRGRDCGGVAPGNSRSRDADRQIGEVGLGAADLENHEGQVGRNFHVGHAIQGQYLARYRDAFGSGALSGLRIGVFEHSSVARELLSETLGELGAEPVPLGRSDRFVAVDTEAIGDDVRTLILRWTKNLALDATVSADGDGDRPLVADSKGEILPGDTLGAMACKALGASVVCTPVTSNSVVDCAGHFGFGKVIRTRIGSPHVIAAMRSELAKDANARVAGYEANGGFLLGFRAKGRTGELAPLMTRDAILPIVAVMADAVARRLDLEQLVAGLPSRFTASGLLANVCRETARALVDELGADLESRERFLKAVCRRIAALSPGGSGSKNSGGENSCRSVDVTDGCRMLLADGSFVHVRLSGNAPELRCYAESGSKEGAQLVVNAGLAALGDAMRPN